jgi:hypothetical protein
VEAPYEPVEAPSKPIDAVPQPADVPSEPVISSDDESALDDRKAEEIKTTNDKTHDSQDPRNNRNSAFSESLRKSTSSALPRTPRSQDTARTHGPSKLRTSETAQTISIDSPLGRGTPKGRQSRIPRSSQASSSSHLGNASTDQLNAKNSKQIKGVNAKMVKAKQSVRNLFKRGEKGPNVREQPAPSKGFMSGTRSSLAKVIRDSKSLSRVNISIIRRTESRSEMRSRSSASRASIEVPPVPTLPNTAPPSVPVVPEVHGVSSVPDVKHQSALSVPEATPSSLPQEGTTTHLDAAGVAVLSILRSIESLPRDSPERLRAMEIAEVSKQLHTRNAVLNELLVVTNTKQAVINVAQLSRNAHVSAVEAKMHAREAELHAQSAEIELQHLQKLCEGVGFDPMSLKMIKQLIKNAGLAVVEHELREIVEEDLREDALAQNAEASGLHVPRT